MFLKIVYSFIIEFFYLKCEIEIKCYFICYLFYLI